MRHRRTTDVIHSQRIGAGVAVTTAGIAQAAEPADHGLSEVVVTGSRVRGEAPVGSAVTTIGRAEINASAAVTVDRMIQELPQVFDLGVSENSRGQPGGAGNIVSANRINLRGIGANATLTLVDGHCATSNGRSINPSVLPSLAAAATTRPRPAPSDARCRSVFARSGDGPDVPRKPQASKCALSSVSASRPAPMCARMARSASSTRPSRTAAVITRWSALAIAMRCFV
jgi:hypothetical protein